MHALSHHQKTLHHAIDWSYNQLTPTQKLFFANLSIFEDCFTLETAEEIFSGTPFEMEVVDLLESLLEKSLLQRASEECDEPKFYMFTIIRQFAAERLREYTENRNIPPEQPAAFIMVPQDTTPRTSSPVSDEDFNLWWMAVKYFRSNGADNTLIGIQTNKPVSRAG